MRECIGKIIKGIAGFYYVHVEKEGVYECKAKGAFRKQGIKPLVGDNVRLVVLEEAEKRGNMVEILPRDCVLVRPAVANINQAMVVFAAAEPNPNFNLLDRFLISMQQQNVETVICFNKMDMVDNKELELLEKTYQNSGFLVRFMSVLEETGLEGVRSLLQNKTTVLAGPSGVGKSSFLNWLLPEAKMETGEISEKIKRGKHTTRHSEIFYLAKDTYILDTPGFSSLYVNSIEKEQLRQYFNEFTEYENSCRFLGCMHLSEPDCAVKQALQDGLISRIRYDNYQQLMTECQEKRRW